MRGCINALRRGNMKTFLYLKYKQFLTWIGDLYLSTKPPAVRWENVEKLIELAQPGDVICRGYDGYVDGYFIPGEYSHSGIILNSREVIHSVAEGVSSIHLGDFVIDTDRFILLRPVYLNGPNETTDRAIWHCEYNKTQYDFSFTEGVKEVYCHELTADCLAQGGVSVPKILKKFGIWPITFSKEIYLFDSFKELTKIYEFKEDL